MLAAVLESTTTGVVDDVDARETTEKEPRAASPTPEHPTSEPIEPPHLRVVVY